MQAISERNKRLFHRNAKGLQPSREQNQLDQFTSWFSRSRNTLHYMADLILNDSEMAELAVQNCRRKASRDLPGFEIEGEFRGWIFRVLIDEALTVSISSDRQMAAPVF
jgi:DNA-directed RNA polymerase specialized sigma24 family protein